MDPQNQLSSQHHHDHSQLLHHALHIQPPASNSILDNVNVPPLPPPNPAGAEHLHPRSVYLKDHVSIATIYPVFSAAQIHPSIIRVLHNEFNMEIERGDTYPMEEHMTLEKFAAYWFGSFAMVMVAGRPEDHGPLTGLNEWHKLILGTFYVKPNYPGRSAHVCNAGFLTTFPARGQGCGKLLGESYLEFAPRLGYTYSVFNLVYETNIASCKIWDSLGFKRIGMIKGAGRLRSYPDQFINAIIYGRDLKNDDDYVSEERFDKIRYYLEKGKYPPSADRSEKSRLRSAATHYKLQDGKLMLKDKEVISDGQQQYDIAKTVHAQSHGGINKTTASIAEKYHWVRIKETVSQVIRNCAECKEHGKVPSVRADQVTAPRQDPNSMEQASETKEQSIESQPPPMQPLDLQQQLQQHQHHQQQIQQQIQQARAHQPHQMMPVPTSLSMPQHGLILPHEQADAARAATIAQVVAGLEIPVDPQMIDIEHSDHRHQLVQQFAPVAAMHHHQMDPGVQHTMAVAAAQAALGHVREEDGTLKDRHLMETLTAELKKGGYGDSDR